MLIKLLKFLPKLGPGSLAIRLLIYKNCVYCGPITGVSRDLSDFSKTISKLKLVFDWDLKIYKEVLTITEAYSEPYQTSKM